MIYFPYLISFFSLVFSAFWTIKDNPNGEIIGEIDEAVLETGGYE